MPVYRKACVHVFCVPVLDRFVCSELRRAVPGMGGCGEEGLGIFRGTVLDVLLGAECDRLAG